MRKATAAQILGLASLGSSLAFGQIDKPLPNNVQQSAQFIRVSDGKPLYQRNETLLLSPASTTKLVTSAAVLAKFSPQRRFRTKFFFTGNRIGEKISGDLVVVGDGDPFIVSENLWQLAADVAHMGIKQFDGNLIIDNSLFDATYRDASRVGGVVASTHAYDSPVSAFGVNFNTVAIAMVASEKPGNKALVNFDPYPIKGFTIQNNLLTAADGRSQGPEVERVANGHHSTTLNVTGKLAQGTAMQKLYRSVDDHLWASGELLRAFLQSAGISVAGEVREGRLPSGAKLFYELESYDMAKIVSGLNKFSNNYIADVLTKRLGAAFPLSGQADAVGSGTYENGVKVLNHFLLQDVGVKPGFILLNGSGLSIENRLSAEHLTKVLAYMAAHMQFFPEFLASLPAAGWDGTLKDRFRSSRNAAVFGGIRAKTGTLSSPISVCSLAGYLNHPKHGLVAFAMIDNGIQGARQPGIADIRERQDKTLEDFLTKL